MVLSRFLVVVVVRLLRSLCIIVFFVAPLLLSIRPDPYELDSSAAFLRSRPFQFTRWTSKPKKTAKNLSNLKAHQEEPFLVIENDHGNNYLNCLVVSHSRPTTIIESFTS